MHRRAMYLHIQEKHANHPRGAHIGTTLPYVTRIELIWDPSKAQGNTGREYCISINSASRQTKNRLRPTQPRANLYGFVFIEGPP